MMWLRRFLWYCVAAVVLAMGSLALWFVLGDHGLSTNGMIALAGGAFLTLVLTIALMGLLFASHRQRPRR